ncbi:MAG: Ig-like domain-containing protein [Candidatus Rifleibacteriota bacterium]
MAIKKADKMLRQKVYRSVLLLLMIFATVNGVWANITNQTAVISSDLNGDGIAGIGDTITFTCRSTTADQDQYPYVNLSQFGNPYFALPNIAGTFYSAFLTVSPGNIENNTTQTFQFVDEDGVRMGGSLLIDNRRPYSTYGPSATGGTGTSGYYKIGDTLQLDITMNSALDGDIPRANLTNIGLGASHIFSRVGGPDSEPVYQLALTFPNNREGVSTGIQVSATDDAGNSRSWDLAVNYDTIAPEIQSVTAVNMTTGKSWVTSGDTIRIQAVIDSYDYDKVVMYNDDLFPGGITMIKDSGAVGSEATFTYDYYLADVPDIQSNFVTFEVRAEDDVGNESSPRISNPLALDNIPPEFALPFGVKVIEKGGIKGDNIAIIGDQLHFYGNLSSIMDDVTVTVDLSSIGGVSNQIIPFNNSATTTFELWYDIHQYTSDDVSPRAFTIYAKDDAGNEISRITMPIVYVDNDPPVISAGQVTNASRAGQTVRHGDNIAIQANLTGIDGGSIWTDFTRIGGTASSTLTPYSGTTYRLEHTVGDPASGKPYDRNVPFTIYAADDAGNLVYTVSNSIGIDNEKPEIIGDAYTSSPAISGSHPYVRVDDRLTFKVQLASSSANVHDNEIVEIDLTEFGETVPVEMTYDGVGTYTLSVDVPSGDLNNDHYFGYRAEDDAGNAVSGVIKVKIDNKNPDVGPMAVNFMTDLNKSGVVNIGDRLEFIVPVPDQDYGTCTIDLSYVGGDSAYVMNYDPVLQRYYLVHDCEESAMENTSYVFKATVSDKAGNKMNSLSDTFEVDCRPPVIMSASATVQQLYGKSNVVNVGDKVTILAEVEKARVDGGTPRVNLSSLGGSSSQNLYDDGAHGDNLADDGIYGYVHTVASGTTNGEDIALTVELTDNAGNRDIASTNTMFVDNKPLIITKCENNQVFDNNGNTIVDLDGTYTTYPSVATDVVRIEVDIQGDDGDMGTLTVDLSKLGINDTAREVPYTSIAGGWRATEDYMPIEGTTDDEEVQFTVKLTDVNGNETVKTCTNKVRIDNRPPKLQIYPISFVVDEGRLNEANLDDVIQVRLRVSNNNDILPMIDFTNLYLDNGLTPPSPTLFPPPTQGEYVYEWTVPEGLGTVGSLTILAYDASGNMKYGYTNEIRFLSKTPTFAPYPQTRADLSLDDNPPESENNIANPANYKNTTADEVTLTVVMTSLYNADNDPAATVLADIRSIIKSPSDDSDSKYSDGDMKTYWVPLTYQAGSSGAGNYVYRDTFTVTAGKVDIVEAEFDAKVLHPDVSSIVLASTTINCDPDDPFGIDTELPDPQSVKFSILDENNDNIASNSVNINDLLRISTTIKKFEDPGSATAVLLMSDEVTEIYKAPLYQIPGTETWEALFRVATHTDTGWPALDGVSPKYRVIVTDDAQNYSRSAFGVATFTIDNTPPKIIDSELRVENRNLQNWVANVGDGYKSNTGDRVSPDGIVASITVSNAADLSGQGVAYINFNSIDATSTYELTEFQNAATVYCKPLNLATNTFDLATRTFRIYVRDGAGNMTWKEKELAIDTTRPELQSASYDGTSLRLNFSERIDPLFMQSQLEFVRLGSKMDHNDVQVPDGATPLDPKQDKILETSWNDRINIQLSSATKAIVADWGDENLYISIAHDTTTGEATPGHDYPTYASAPLGLDEAGNWLKPLPRTLATFPVNVPVTYTDRPHLVTGSYNANTPSEKDFLYLEFDKDMDETSITTDTLRNLSIWKNRGNPSDTYANRYRFITTAASDTIVGLDTSKRLKIRLSQEAQDWIALNYGKNGSVFNLQINGSEYEPPDPSDPAPLIRDFYGNRVVPIKYNNATPATMIPLRSQFSVREDSFELDLTGSQPILKMQFQTGPERRARLYRDPYKNLAETIELSRDLPVDLSRVYLYANSDLTGGSMPLNENMVDFSEFKNINVDYASNTVTIPLTSDALKTMLGWGTSKFYIACSENAFVDLWGNGNIRAPVQGDEAVSVNTLMPGTIAAPRIQTLAVSPAITKTSESIQLCKGQPAGNFYYEVAFETASLSADVYIPIDRTKTPSLKFYTQNDATTPKDTATFVSWLDHNQGGVTRTVARFVNNSDLTSSQNIQREPCFVEVSNFADVFSGSTTFTETASLSYNLDDKDSSSNGFQNGSHTIVLDNQLPQPLSVIPTGTIGITPANSAQFDVTFNEPMDQSVGTSWYPKLRLGDSSTTVMSFTFENWVNSTTARFTNSSNFDANTPQGTYTYYVSRGFDEAGNRGNNDVAMSDKLQIRSKGPTISSYRVSTYQTTTAKNSSPTGDLVDYPFSPYVRPGIATITVNFQAAPNASDLWLHFYQGEASLASIPITLDGLSGTASWDGTLKNGPIGSTGPTSYVLRVYDDAANEGSKRGSIVYDGLAPKVSSWNFTNVKTYNGKAYFSPLVNSFVKIEVFGPSSGDTLRMRLTNPGLSTDTYPLTGLSGGGYTTSFDGNNTDTPQGTLLDGEYQLCVVDRAGNLGQPLGASSQATGTLVIDRTAPVISSIKTYRVDNGNAVSRFNPRVTNMRIEVNTTDPTIGSGTALIKVMAGSSLVKELMLQGGASPYYVEWDGTDSELQPVTDGTYKLSVADLAGNESTNSTVDVTVVNSIFKVTSVKQIDKNNIRVTFSHAVNADDGDNPNLYSLTPATPVGIGAASPISVEDNVVEIPLNQNLSHDTLYTLTVDPGFRSIDDDPIVAGNNSAQFTADAKGPIISAITYDGLSSQKEFNLVFDEQVEAESAQQIGNYDLTTGTDTVAIDSISLRADLKSVTITAFDEIVETKNYTIVASGVEDLFGNKSDSEIARVTFQGQDITPPELTITAFSNPANEFDISVAVSSNEDLSGAPTATITQSGGTAVSLVLNSGPNNRIFIGGTHLDVNYPGVATIEVTASDISLNSGTADMSFSTAFVNSSLRASVKSPDERFEAVFEPGTLNQDSMVAVMPEHLDKIEDSESQASMIVPSAMAQLNLNQVRSIRASRVQSYSDKELEPIGTAYSVELPAGRLEGSLKASYKLTEEQMGDGTGLYRSDVTKGWVPVNHSFKDGKIEFAANEPGTFAIMKDVMAPRASVITKVDEHKPIREPKPSFIWAIEEFGSGLDLHDGYALLNGKIQPIMFDPQGKSARFVPTEDLIGGEYDLSLRLSDKAGNQVTTKAIRFKSSPPLNIYEVTQFPNPANRRVNLRISTNRPDVDAGEIEVKIYDVSGHKVADMNQLILRPDNNGALPVQDVIWDLRAAGGREVANGVYFARITLRDPDNWNKKTRYTHKIAVLR